MSSDVRRLPIKRLAECVLGKMLQPSDGGDDLWAPYMRAANVQPDGALRTADSKEMWFSRPELQQLALQRGDVVVVEGGIGGYGRAAYLSEDLAGWGFQNSIIRLRPRAGVDGRFLTYALLSERGSGYIEAYCNIVSMPHFTAEKVANLALPAPPACEQRAIADFLDEQTTRIDTLIDKQTRLITTLRERRTAVVDRCFLDVEGNSIRLRYLFDVSSEANVPGEQVLSVYREFGVIPKSSRSDNFNKTPENVDRYLLVHPGDLVVNRMKAWQGSLGVSNHRGIVSGDYEVLRPRDSRLGWAYAHYFLRSPRLVNEYRVRSTGIRPAQWRLYWEAMAEIRIPVPDHKFQARAVAYLDEQTSHIDALIAKSEEHIALAQERRAALITAAVTGQIDVRTAGRPLDDVV